MAELNKQKYVQALLNDIEALDYMIDNDWIEEDKIRIGAEQEMVIIDRHDRPFPIAAEVIEEHQDLKWLAPELSRFNLEINLDPIAFNGTCFSEMEQQLTTKVNHVAQILDEKEAKVVLFGILPTLRKNDLGLHNLSPFERYRILIDALKAEHGNRDFELRLSGIDELNVNHDTALLEACNTSFQVHLQVGVNDFLPSYVSSQILAAPLLAIAANSPLVFGRRLWHESRIALFQQAIDTRKIHTHMRERSPRVNFGGGWNYSRITDIYREDISRFKALFSETFDYNSMDQVRNGQNPDLEALKLFNSTVYRWNRPCFGVSGGKPHLRIENRVIPSGPSVIDEVANSAFWLGAVVGQRQSSHDLRQDFEFVDIRDNFSKAARYGLDTYFTWGKNKKIGASELIVNELVPMAKSGLQSMGVDQSDVDRYIGVIEERARRHMTGARWSLIFYSNLLENMNRFEAQYHLTQHSIKNQKNNSPVHEWEIPTFDQLKSLQYQNMKVDEFMTTEIITVFENDLLKIAAEILLWNKIDYIVVENEDGNVVGVLDEKLIIAAMLNIPSTAEKPLTVKDAMNTEFASIQPEASIKEAYDLMIQSDQSCIVVCNDLMDLRGIISKHNFYYLAGRMLSFS